MKFISDKRTALDKYAASIISEKISELGKDNITLALPGGRSVNGIFQQLIVQKIDWEKIHIFLTDERIVPLDHPASNFRQLKKNLLDKIAHLKQLPEANIHYFKALEENLEKAISDYSQQLADLGGYFDILLLSAGEDGHVASLFPEHETLYSDKEYYVFVKGSPKPPPNRISISRKLLLRSQTAILLFYGPAKKNALNKFKDKKIDPESCPAKYCKKTTNSYLLTDL